DRDRIKLVGDFDLIDFETVDGLYLGRRGRSFEPGRGTPWVGARDSNQTVFHRILMDVIQSGEIRLLIGELLVPKVVPDSSRFFSVELVDLAGSVGMEFGQKVLQCLRRRGVGNEVVVV